MDDQRMNIVSGVRVVASEIISVLLVRRGEHPILWDYGLAPELFEALSDYEPQAWVYEAEQTIQRWVAGLERLTIQIEKEPDQRNRLSAYILFRTSATSDSNLLTFPWYEYQGAVADGDFDQFLEGVSINGARWQGLDRN
jgi:hypothetical protein